MMMPGQIHGKGCLVANRRSAAAPAPRLLLASDA